MDATTYGAVPLDLRPLVQPSSRSSKPNVVYQDLSKHQFTQSEKKFLVREVCNESLYLPRPEGSTNLTAAEVCKRYNIPASTFSTWKGKVLDPTRPVYSSAGRQRDIDEIGTDRIVQAVKDARNDQHTMSVSGFNSMYKEEKKKSLERATIGHEDAENVDVNIRSRGRFQDENDIVLRKAQNLTKAREEALKDIRVTLRQAM
jgi:hypothetical protein